MKLVPDTTWWGADRPPATSPVCAVPGNLDSHGQASSGSAVVESDKHGTKAEPLDHFAARARRAYLRFDDLGARPIRRPFRCGNHRDTARRKNRRYSRFQCQ
jgi:hypothetical protein